MQTPNLANELADLADTTTHTASIISFQEQQLCVGFNFLSQLMCADLVAGIVILATHASGLLLITFWTGRRSAESAPYLLHFSASDFSALKRFCG